MVTPLSWQVLSIISILHSAASAFCRILPREVLFESSVLCCQPMQYAERGWVGVGCAAPEVGSLIPLKCICRGCARVISWLLSILIAQICRMCTHAEPRCCHIDCIRLQYVCYCLRIGALLSLHRLFLTIKLASHHLCLVSPRELCYRGAFHFAG